MSQVFEVNNINGIMFVCTSGSDENYTNGKYDGYLFSIEYETFGDGVRIFDVQAESMPFKGKYYIIMDGDSEPFVTRHNDMRYDHNIVSGFFGERVNPNYIETMVLDMDNLAVSLEDDTEALEEIIRDRRGNAEHEKQESTYWGL